MTGIIALGLVATFLGTMLTGPYFVERREQKKELKNKPLAKIIPFPYKGRHPNKV